MRALLALAALAASTFPAAAQGDSSVGPPDGDVATRTHVGVALGGPPVVTGLRLTARDRGFERVDGVNATLGWRPDMDRLGVVNGLAVGLAASAAGTLAGVAVGGFGAATERDLTGAALAAGGAGAGGSLRGVAVGGLGVGAGGNLAGIAVGGLGAGAGGRLTGVAVGGLIAGSGGEARGLLVGGLAASAPSVRGAALGGLAASAEDTRGVLASAGLVHVPAGGVLRGVALGAVTNVRGEMRGLSIGLVNYARTLHGVQIGLINYAGNNRTPARLLPLVNVHL